MTRKMTFILLALLTILVTPGLARTTTVDAHLNSGNIAVSSAVADGIHCDWFIMNNGTLHITASGDGIDSDEGFVEINGGDLFVTDGTMGTTEATPSLTSQKGVTLSGALTGTAFTPAPQSTRQATAPL